MTVTQVARELGLAEASASRLLQSGYVGAAYRLAGRTHSDSSMLTSAQAAELAAVPFVTHHPETLVVRCGPRQEDTTDDPRKFFGYDPDATWEELTAALGRWWPVGDPAYWAGKAMIATLAGYVVHVGRITGWQVKRRAGFDLEPDPTLDKAFAGKRLPTVRGGLIQHLADTADTE